MIVEHRRSGVGLYLLLVLLCERLLVLCLGCGALAHVAVEVEIKGGFLDGARRGGA